MRSWALGVWVLCICLIMISERVTLLKPLSRQHPPLILLNPQNNGLLHAGDCDRFLSSCSEGSVCLHTANTTMIAVQKCLPSWEPSPTSYMVQSTERAEVTKAQPRRLYLRCFSSWMCTPNSSVWLLFSQLTRLPCVSSLLPAMSHHVSYGRIKAGLSVQPEGLALVLARDYDQRAEVIQTHWENHKHRNPMAKLYSTVTCT